MMKAILFDLDGVIYQGEQALPGAHRTLAWVRQQRIPHLYLTNTTSRPRSHITRKLARLGMSVPEREILTPPVAARSWLQDHGVCRLALFLPEATQAEFAGIEILGPERDSGADAVVLGDLGDGWSFARLNRAFRLLMTQPHPYLIALGMTRYWRAPDGLRLDTAPFVVALAHASGVEPVVLGKPARPFFAAALKALGTEPGETLMIGDDIRGDIGGSQSAGLPALLVRTGKFRQEDLHGDIRPDGVIDTIGDLPAWWRAHAPAG